MLERRQHLVRPQFFPFTGDAILQDGRAHNVPANRRSLTSEIGKSYLRLDPLFAILTERGKAIRQMGPKGILLLPGKRK